MVPNLAPSALDDTYVTDEDTELSISASGVLSNDTDLNGDGLTVALTTDVLSGTLTLNVNGGFIYTPTLNFNGPITFTYRATDSLAYSNPALVTITVNALNDPPVAEDDAYSGWQGKPLTTPAPGVLANDTDVDSIYLTATLVSNVLTGALGLSPLGDE